eukprot:CAMPEP_0201509958 /NCGR_PEP_ID=MMETSP0161_2-20130828/2855_1 /ASSEMBLY_ACC=CAM_ASM_000251 /TAXON_ID=180227 /ORGANISM="Neoparamoeba aestuarina, Strain SoJaBio B1-5/56/2" /LENGTH=37 /DNA_ID= /DNA_START= /DNA_END= /DNA_ORIENTATION=
MKNRGGREGGGEGGRWGKGKLGEEADKGRVGISAGVM